jgi:hypothetical protein
MAPLFGHILTTRGAGRTVARLGEAITEPVAIVAGLVNGRYDNRHRARSSRAAGPGGPGGLDI